VDNRDTEEAHSPYPPVDSPVQKVAGCCNFRRNKIRLHGVERVKRRRRRSEDKVKRATRDFQEFAIARTPQLHRTAWLLAGEHHLAEDLVQETLAKLYRAWRRVEQADNPAWSYPPVDWGKDLNR
jgi:hypothetical protein